MIVKFLYFQFVVNFLKELFLTNCLIFSPLINSSQKTNLISNLVILVSTNCYQLSNSELRNVFLNKSKDFNKVWHEGLVFKLKHNSISGELLQILSDFLSNKKQRVVLKIVIKLVVQICREPRFMLDFYEDLI